MELNNLIDFQNRKYNWYEIEKVPEFAVLNSCQQNPVWHMEGDALTHTKQVCEAMLDILREEKISKETTIKILMTSALFHDIGKGVTTEFKKGNWHSYGHEIEGEKITRSLLWNEDICFRESVCSLVRWHMEPLRVFEGKDYLIKIARLSNVCVLKNLVRIKEADLRGSIQKDEVGKHNDFLKLEAIKKYSRILHCDNSSSCLPTETCEFEWNKQRGPHTVYVLIGLPGAGKDTYINNTLLRKDLEPLTKEDTVILSRDDIRTELGFCKAGEKIVGKKDEEDAVSDIFNDRLTDAAKNKKNIIINNINLRKIYRDDYHKQLDGFNYRFVYVYIEPLNGIDINISRREGQIKKEVFESLIRKMDWPVYNEYDALIISRN